MNVNDWIKFRYPHKKFPLVQLLKVGKILKLTDTHITISGNKPHGGEFERSSITDPQKIEPGKVADWEKEQAEDWVRKHQDMVKLTGGKKIYRKSRKVRKSKKSKKSRKTRRRRRN